MSRKPSSRSAVGVTDSSSGNAQSSNSMTTPFERSEHRRNLDQVKSKRLIEPEHLSGGNSKQKRVTDVPGGASHSDFNRSFHGAISHKRFAEQSLTQNPSGELSRSPKSSAS